MCRSRRWRRRRRRRRRRWRWRRHWRGRRIRVQRVEVRPKKSTRPSVAHASVVRSRNTRPCGHGRGAGGGQQSPDGNQSSNKTRAATQVAHPRRSWWSGIAQVALLVACDERPCTRCSASWRYPCPQKYVVFVMAVSVESLGIVPNSRTAPWVRVIGGEVDIQLDQLIDQTAGASAQQQPSQAQPNTSVRVAHGRSSTFSATSFGRTGRRTGVGLIWDCRRRRHQEQLVHR